MRNDATQGTIKQHKARQHNIIRGKTRQVKIRQDKTRQGNKARVARQDKIRQYKTRYDNAWSQYKKCQQRQDNARNIRQDKRISNRTNKLNNTHEYKTRQGKLR